MEHHADLLKSANETFGAPRVDTPVHIRWVLDDFHTLTYYKRKGTMTLEENATVPSQEMDAIENFEAIKTLFQTNELYQLFQ